MTAALRARSPARPAAAFRPSDLAGLIGHYRADRCVLNGGTVSTWPDLSGAGRDFVQATEAAQPAYASAGLAGRPALLFDGGASKMAAAGWSLGADYDLTVIAAARFDAVDGGRALFDSTDSGATNDGTMVFIEGGSLKLRRGSGGAAYAFSSTAAHVLTAVDQAAGRTICEDGVARNTEAVAKPGKAVTDMRIGALFGDLYFFDGAIAELVVYGRALADAERRQVERAMGRCYGAAVG